MALAHSRDVSLNIQGGRLALGPFRLSKLGRASLSAMREPDFEPFSWFEFPFWESKNIKVGVYKKSNETQVDRPKMHVVRDTVLQKCASYQKKCTFHKSIFFEISSSLIIALFFLPSAAQSSKIIMSHGARFQGFWDFLAHFEVEECRNFLVRNASQNSMLLPRVVCLCGSVGVCGECHGVN